MTKSLHTKSHIGPDGVLNLALPVGMANTDVDVRIVVEPIGVNGTSKTGEQEEWHRFLDSITGKWEGPLERPPQGEFEVRPEWP
jgi:hypothetical protein